MTTPPTLRKGDIDNFNTLLEACETHQACLISAIRKADNKPVALVCAVQINEDASITPVPFAVMVEGNPYELFEDPTRNDT